MANKILWVDDELESLKSQIIFLKNKGYEVFSCSNGHYALDFLKTEQVDVVLLDESMPGITGIETLALIREQFQHLPVVMITKNEEENIMEEAIGSQITDYLIKPVNPNQVLLSLKKIFDSKSLVSDKTVQTYLQEFRNMFEAINNKPNYEEWVELYKKLVYWELEIQKSESLEMMDVFRSQKDEANQDFCKFIEKNYASWIKNENEAPMMSHNLMKQFVFPRLNEDVSTFFILIDNLRFDQWKTIQPILNEYFVTKNEEIFSAILPTSTQYSRNSIFSGLLRIHIEKKFPNEWKNDAEEGGKNLHEELFLKELIKRELKKEISFSYTKITNDHNGELLVNNIQDMLHNQLNVVVYNFVDMLST